ncbi:6703_t:CDS:2, partial [Cetraspora pellucida]
TNILETALKNIFNLSEYQEYQQKSIESFINRHNILMILKTEGGKTLIYAIASLLFKELTVVFTLLKSLIDDQLATFYASSEQPPELQERIFRELASGLTKKDDEIRFIFATNAFRIGINISDIRAIIYTTFPMSFDSFIQEIGCADCNDNVDVKDIKNIEISQEFDKSSSLTEIVALTNQNKHLKEKRKQLLEI